MEKTLDAQALLNGEHNPEKTNADGDYGAADFKADVLHCVITRPNGEIVLECNMEPRGFKAAKNGTTKQVRGGVGWYTAVSGDDCGSYGPFPVSAGLRLSLAKIKVAPDTKIDIREGAEDSEE